LVTTDISPQSYAYADDPIVAGYITQSDTSEMGAFNLDPDDTGIAA
jgi:hypothetical protein